MMEEKDIFTIYIDRLRNGEVEELSGTASSHFLDICEDDLKFNDTVSFNGSAYLAGDTLCIQLSAHAKFQMPCRLCNEIGCKKIHLDKIYFTAKEDEFKNGLFLFDKPLREAIIIEIPKFITCGASDCLNRKSVESLLHKDREHTSSPFASIDLGKN